LRAYLRANYEKYNFQVLFYYAVVLAIFKQTKMRYVYCFLLVL